MTHGTAAGHGRVELAEMSLTEFKNHLGEAAEHVCSGGVTYVTRYGRRLGAFVPAEVAEEYERAEDTYLATLADETQAEPDEFPLTTGAVVRELGLHDSGDEGLSAGP